MVSQLIAQNKARISTIQPSPFNLHTLIHHITPIIDIQPPLQLTFGVTSLSTPRPHTHAYSLHPTTTTCSINKPTTTTETLSKSLTATAIAAFLLTAPCQPSLAVSGGGGMATSLAFQDLSGQDLRKSKYTKADLRGADFSNANLEGVTLFGAICVDAKFVGANLRGADLESADLEGADLTNAVLEGALLTNTQFKQVKSIEGADFTDALIRKDVQMGLCKIASGTNPVTGVDTRESLFCP